jgi:hypothetical protein
MPQDRGRRVLGQRPLTSPGLLVWSAGWLLAAALVLGAGSRPAPAQTQDPLILEGEDVRVQYVITMSGTVGRDTFSGVRGLLTLGNYSPKSANPYQVIVEVFPVGSSRNMFAWSSDEGTMDALGGSIRSRLRVKDAAQQRSCFYYLSPKLLAIEGMGTQHDWEERKIKEQTTPPTRITALTGEMRLSASPDRVRGQVLMTGRDTVGNEYVRYFAKFEGRTIQSFPVQP